MQHAANRLTCAPLMALQTASSTPHVAKLVNQSIDWLAARRFQIIVILLLLQVVAFCTQGIWVEDFWEHSAAVNAFINRPLDPGHPQLAVLAPHPFLNPYTFFVAQVARIFHLDAITALSGFGILNFCLFCYGLHAFVASLQISNEPNDRNSKQHGVNHSPIASSVDSTKCTSINNNTIAFYSLLFILFLWGGKPWPYSGFFNYQIYLLNLPYPSTFVGGLSLLGLAINARHLRNPRYADLLILIAITSIALLTHPLTAQFLLIGFVAQVFMPRAGANKTQPDTSTPIIQTVLIPFLKIAILSIASLGLAMLWPYYPILELFQAAGKAYDISNGDMYFHFFTRTWPFILLAPIFLWMLVMPQLRTLLIVFTFTTVIYIFGYLTERYSFGRIISYTIICIQIACAVAAYRVEGWVQRLAPVAARLGQSIIGVILIIGASSWLYDSANRLLTVTNSLWLGRTVSNQVTYKEYIFLQSHVEPGSIVFANTEASWIAPSFGAKVVAVDHTVAFITDLEKRQLDVLTFFRPQTELQERKALLKKYRAEYLLLDKKLDNDWSKIDQQFSDVLDGSGKFETEKFLLLKLKTPL